MRPPTSVPDSLRKLLTSSLMAASSGLELRKGDSLFQHRQRVAQVNHVVQAGAKEVLGGGISKHQNLPETDAYWNSNWEFWLSAITPKYLHSCGLQRFCRGDELESSRGVALAERQVARANQELVEFERLQRHAELAVQLLCLDSDQQMALINKAKARVQRWRANDLCSEDYISRWEAMLAKPVAILAKEMVSDCDGWGRALRQNTPFTLRPQARA